MPRLNRPAVADPAAPPPASISTGSVFNPANQPVGWATAVGSLLSAVLFLLGTFDVWQPTSEQTNAIFLVYSAAIGVIGVVVNRKTTPNATLEPGR